MLTPKQVIDHFKTLRIPDLDYEREAVTVLKDILPLEERGKWLEEDWEPYSAEKAKDSFGKPVDDLPLTLCNCEFSLEPYPRWTKDTLHLLPPWEEKPLSEIRDFYELEARREVIEGYPYTARMFYNRVRLLDWILERPTVPFGEYSSSVLSSQAPSGLGSAAPSGLGNSQGIAASDLPGEDLCDLPDGFEEMDDDFEDF